MGLLRNKMSCCSIYPQEPWSTGYGWLCKSSTPVCRILDWKNYQCYKMYSTNINVLHKFKKDLKQSSSSRYSLNWHRIYLAFNQFYLLKCFPISIQKQQKDYHVTSHLCIKTVYISLPQLNGTAIFPYNNSSHLGKRNTNVINQISQSIHRTSLLLPFLSTKPMQKYLKWFFKQRSPLRQCLYCDRSKAMSYKAYAEIPKVIFQTEIPLKTMSLLWPL